MKNIQAILAGVLMLITGGLIGVLLFMAYLFPQLVEVWENQARALSTFEMLLVNTSEFCSHFGLWVLPILFFAFLTSLVCLIMGIKGTTKENPSSISDAV